MMDFAVEWDTTYGGCEEKIISQGWAVLETTDYYLVSHGTFNDKSDADALLEKLQERAREFLLKQAREANDPKEPYALDVGERVFWRDGSHRDFGTIVGRRRGYSPRGGFREHIYYTVENEQCGGRWESYPMGSELNYASTGKPCFSWHEFNARNSQRSP